jgi:iron complex outermembrane receptor protein
MRRLCLALAALIAPGALAATGPPPPAGEPPASTPSAGPHSSSAESAGTDPDTSASAGSAGTAADTGPGTAASAGAAAATDADGSTSSALTEEVLVRARAPRPEDAAFATVVPADDLARRGADLSDLLRRVPGARVASYGGIGQFATVSLRGSTAEQVTLLIDGVPQNRALGGPVDLSSIPASQVAEVAVYRGFAPAALGLDGLGGAIDVRTRRPVDEVSGVAVDLVAGSLATARAAAGWGLPFADGQGGVRLALEAFRSDGDFVYLDTAGTIYEPSDDQQRTRANNDSSSLALQFQGVLDRVAGGELSFGLRGRTGEGGVPGPDSLPSETARLDEDAANLALGWTRGAWELAADGFGERTLFDDPDADLGVRRAQETRIGGAGLGAAWRGRAGAHHLLVRADARWERARVTDDALALPDRGGGTRTSLSIAAEDALALGRWTIAPALRWKGRDDRFVAGADGLLPPPATSGDDAWLDGKLAVAYAVGAADALRASAGRFSRDPSLVELFGDRGAVVGNPRLKPETGLKAELGYALGERDWGGWRLAGELVAFGSRIDDMILMWPNAQGVVVPRNIASAQLYGLEGSLALRVPGDLVLEAAGTLLHSQDTSGGFADGNPLPGRPGQEGFLAARWSPGRWQLGWELTYVGENSTDPLDLPRYRIPARTLNDAMVSCAVGRGFRVGLEVRNIFDVETRDVLRFPLPGRMVFASLSWAPGEGR